MSDRADVCPRQLVISRMHARVTQDGTDNAAPGSGNSYAHVEFLDDAKQSRERGDDRQTAGSKRARARRSSEALPVVINQSRRFP